MILVCDDNCGVLANKYILILFFIVISPSLFPTKKTIIGRVY